MKKYLNLSRREFLKIAGLLAAGSALPRHFAVPGQSQASDQAPNVLIIVFDAWSAYHVSLYGYDRLTTPNIQRLADKAIVYHNHIAGGNFTLPGTTSLLSGTLSWRHRAYGFPIDKVQEHFSSRNLFHLLPGHYRMAYTHNRLSDAVLQVMFQDIEELTPLTRHLLHSDFWIQNFFSRDEDAATVGFLRALKDQEDNLNYSLFASKIYQENVKRQNQKYRSLFPLGLPRYNIDNYFLLETVIDWLINRIPAAQQPFLGYFHFLPPHAPYNTRADFFQTFSKDGHNLVEKPKGIYTEGTSADVLAREAQYYDEFILYVDAEFSRLYHSLENSGVLNNTWVILTSDHGELFERGIRGHGTPLLYHPLIKVPLLVFPPGQQGRMDIFENTSAVDLLPTILNITGQGDKIPDWAEGRVLPPFGPSQNADVFVVEGRGTEQNQPMPHGTITLVRDSFKLIYYFGYDAMKDKKEMWELFDLASDPEELHNIANLQPGLAAELAAVVRASLDENERAFS